MKDFLSILTLFFFLFAASLQGQDIWMKDPANPVLTGALSTWNQNVEMSSVLYDSNSARYEMWFCGDPAIRGDYFWRPFHIGYAVSDDGIHWDQYETPVLDTTAGNWDELTVELPAVLKEGGIYKMWYSGWDLADSGGIGYATSPDGITWTKHPSYIFGTGTGWEYYPYGCYVMPVSGGYKIWYSASDLNASEYNIGYATSSDGITWHRDMINNPVLEVGSPGSWDDYAVIVTSVQQIDGTYCLWYTGINNAMVKNGGFACSDDGIYWKKFNNPATSSLAFAESDPVLMPSYGQWDSSHVESGGMLMLNDTLHMWYTGWTSPAPPNQVQIGHAFMSRGTLDSLILFVLDIEKNENLNIPKRYSLSQNFPNPFNPTTSIEFSIPKAEFVILKIFNLLGQEVATLVADKLKPGNYTYTWDAFGFASGVYYYRLSTRAGFVQTKKLILLR